MEQYDTPTPSERTALAPDLRKLPARAARAWAEEMAVGKLAGPRYAVYSASGQTYVVDLESRECTCPDHRIRGEICKHLRRVALEITSRRVPPPGERVATCERCGTETFVAEDAPTALCDACRLQPGEIVRDHETGDRLVVQRVTGRRATEVEIAAADTTVAAYPTNADYPADDLVVEAVYPRDLARRDDPRVYSFPRSRLERVDDAEIVP